MDFKLIHFKSITSTNDYAKKIQNIKDPLLILSDTQTQGRGRFNKQFYSPLNKGLYMSLVFKPLITIDSLQNMNIALGQKISQYLNRSYSIQSRAVYPNDIYIKEKKLAGILTEGVLNASNYEKVIVGFGLNLIQDCNFVENQAIIALDQVSSMEIDKVNLAQNIAQIIWECIHEAT